MSHISAPPNRLPESDAPRQVSKFEFNLLRILRFVLGHFPSDQGLQLVRMGTTRVECLSKTAVDLIKDTLSKASVLFLVRSGGWRNDRFLRDNKPIEGRVWERVTLEERTLEFSRHVVDFLVWATTEKVHETKVPWDAPANELTPADEMFFWLAYDAFRADPDIAAALRIKRAFADNPLCWLSFPGEMSESDEPTPPDFTSLFQGLRAIILSCLQTHLAGRWMRSERTKGQIGDWKRMRQQGKAEFAALRTFLEAAGSANRIDLARFVLKTNAALFQTEMLPVFWTGGLQGSGPPRLADRLDTQRVALAFPRQMEILEGWQQRSLYVGYFDDDYQMSQMWKQEWEAVGGDRIAARARMTVDMLEPLRTGQAYPTGDRSENNQN